MTTRLAFVGYLRNEQTACIWNEMSYTINFTITISHYAQKAKQWSSFINPDNLEHVKRTDRQRVFLMEFAEHHGCSSHGRESNASYSKKISTNRTLYGASQFNRKFFILFKKIVSEIEFNYLFAGYARSTKS